MKRHDLTKSQAAVLAEIGLRRRAVEKEWRVAVVLAGVEDPDGILAGNLNQEDPHFMVKE